MCTVALTGSRASTISRGSRWRPFAVATAAAVLSGPTPLLASRPGVPYLEELIVEGETVSFVQPDGSRTRLELATGDVLGRGVARPGARGTVVDPFCEPARGDVVCRLPEGLLTLEWSGGVPVVRLTSTEPIWSGVRWADWRLDRFREAGDCLLVESPQLPRQLASLECLDRATGRPRWLYVYPGQVPSHYRVEGVVEARAAIEEAAAHRPTGLPIGTLPVDALPESDADFAAVFEAPYPAPITLDPDPWRGAHVERLRIGAWGLLALGWLAALLSLRLGSGAGRDWGSVLLVGLLGALLVETGDLDESLLRAVFASFLLVWLLTGARMAKERRAPRLALWLVLLLTFLTFSSAHLLRP